MLHLVKWLCVYLLIILYGCSKNLEVSGGASETEATIVLSSNGVPANGAVVKLIDSENWLEKKQKGMSVVLDSTMTDVNGNFRFPEVPLQKINLQINLGEEGVLIEDFIFSENQRVELEKFSALSGKSNIAGTGDVLQIYFMGTDFKTNVNNGNSYEFTTVPKEKLTLVAQTETNSIQELIKLDVIEIDTNSNSHDLYVCGNDGIPDTGSSRLIEVDVFQNGDSVNYELLLIQGSVDSTADSISVNNQRQTFEWPAINGKYKALVDLDSGINYIALHSKFSIPTCLTIEYIPKKSNESIQLAFFVGNDLEPIFQAPSGEPNDTASAKKRIALAGLLNQTAMAELMVKAGFERKTFRLSRDLNNRVKVVPLIGKFSAGEYRELENESLKNELRPMIDSLSRANGVRALGVIGMTQYLSSDSIQANVYTGGGSYSIIGGGTLHTWAEDLSQIVQRFSDSRKVSDFSLSDHSNRRQEFWANNSSGVGVMLFYMGRMLGASATPENNGVMARGFDHLNHIFMLSEQNNVISDELIHWTPENASLLNSSGLID